MPWGIPRKNATHACDNPRWFGERDLLPIRREEIPEMRLAKHGASLFPLHEAAVAEVNQNGLSL